jgi:hypothetical protein
MVATTFFAVTSIPSAASPYAKAANGVATRTSAPGRTPAPWKVSTVPLATITSSSPSRQGNASPGPRSVSSRVLVAWRIETLEPASSCSQRLPSSTAPFWITRPWRNPALPVTFIARHTTVGSLGALAEGA